MIDNNNILLISDDEQIAKLIVKKLVLLRENDSITVCQYKNAKKTLANSLFCVVILHETNDHGLTLKMINSIKETKPDSEIILLLNDINEQLIIDAYDNGIYDYFFCDSEPYEMLIKTINCFKMQLYKDVQKRNEKFLYQLGVMDNKTNLYHYKYLKDIFIDLSGNLRIQNGIFTILTLNEKNKTKVSTNRLATVIKSSVRKDDIIAQARGGKFYLILPNIDLVGAKNLIIKIQDKMGPEFQIHSGLSKIGIQSFETLDKNAQDSLTSAIQNEVISVCLEENIDAQNIWLDDDSCIKPKKNYKLFKFAFTNKMNSVITPIFYRYQKEFENKLTNTNVSQYTNNIECVFCLKNDSLRSELTIHYNGYAKFNIEVKHSGLDSVENTKLEIPLSKMTEKYLTSLLKQLKDEFKQSINKG